MTPGPLWASIISGYKCSRIHNYVCIAGSEVGAGGSEFRPALWGSCAPGGSEPSVHSILISKNTSSSTPHPYLPVISQS